MPGAFFLPDHSRSGRLAQLQSSAAGVHTDQLASAAADRSAHVVRVEPADDSDLEVRTELAIARVGVDLAVEGAWQRDADAAIARIELHVGRVRQRFHSDFDLAIAGAGLDRPAGRGDVDAPVAG